MHFEFSIELNLLFKSLYFKEILDSEIEKLDQQNDQNDGPHDGQNDGQDRVCI